MALGSDELSLYRRPLKGVEYYRGNEFSFGGEE